MSSDTFQIRVESIDGARCVLACLNTTAGSYTEVCFTRSFAVLALFDAAENALDISRAAARSHSDFARRIAATLPMVVRKRRGAPLQAELGAVDFRELLAEPWQRANVERFVASTRVIRRHNAEPVDELRARLQRIEAASGDDKLARYEAMWRELHSYALEVTATDAKWLQHLVPGAVFGTTAYDLWSDDPHSSSTADVTPPPAAPPALPPRRAPALLFRVADLADLLPDDVPETFRRCAAWY